ncbi:hypothetical protein GIB67_033977 [Kingdonia uniflora]|uniref:Uncharacterized protein n=1 Tax=Kingdonia uniflora TaxID=39325 RepID=A0A7J7M684_9MAGN|nr:hypothetical protein GIB67_033977 [Kingdonia uniflora]
MALNLRAINLARNQLSGLIPASIGRMLFLKVLHLHTNRLNGEIFGFLNNASQCMALNLRMINLARNQLSGPIPVSIGRMLFLEVLHLHTNRLNGSVPENIGLLSKLEMLSFSSNALKGVLTELHFAKLTRCLTKNVFKLVCLECKLQLDSTFQSPIYLYGIMPDGSPNCTIASDTEKYSGAGLIKCRDF